MSLERITFKHTGIDVRPHLQDIITEKLQTLDRFLGGKSDVKCEVEFAKVAPQRNGAVFRVEVNISSAGILHRAEATEDTFERAIDEVRSELESELQRSRTKRQSLWRKGARKMKDMIRFGS
jgi:ribosomal subunit interface protein